MESTRLSSSQYRLLSTSSLHLVYSLSISRVTFPQPDSSPHPPTSSYPLALLVVKNESLGESVSSERLTSISSSIFVGGSKSYGAMASIYPDSPSAIMAGGEKSASSYSLHDGRTNYRAPTGGSDIGRIVSGVESGLTSSLSNCSPVNVTGQALSKHLEGRRVMLLTSSRFNRSSTLNHIYFPFILSSSPTMV